MKTLQLSLLALCAALALSGCGRKNLPVAPASVTTPIGQSDTPNGNAPASTANFQRANRISAVQSTTSTSDDLTITPAEITRNPGAPRKSFPLDFLLN